MPFKSDKQRRWMYKNKPEMARRWSNEIRRKHGKKKSASNQGGASVGN